MVMTFCPPRIILIKSDQKSAIHTLNYKHLPAPASNQFPVLTTSGFLLNTTTLNSLSTTTYCFSLIWKMLQLCGEQCQPTWGSFLERSILFGCPKYRPIFKMTTFHFKSSNFTISPLFSHLKHVTRPHFTMSFSIGSAGSYYSVPRGWLRKQWTHSKKQQKE